MTQVRPHRILVVDDDPNICRLIALSLAREGHKCSMAYSGEEATEILENEDFDLVITDLVMPGMSGIDLLNIVTRLFPKMAVMVVTAVDDKETGIMAMELGAAGYIIKPFKINEILIGVSRTLANASRTRAFRSSDSGEPETVGTGLPKRKRLREISAHEFLRCVKSGMSDPELMERFNLSGEGLLDLLSQMGTVGKIDQRDLDERASLAPQTVAVDIDRSDTKEGDKPVIGVGEAVECIRSGMDDVALMKRFGISAKGLSSLFRKLVEAGFLAPEEFYGRPRADHEFVLDMRDTHRRHLAVTTQIWEVTRPDAKGWLLNVTERGLGTSGLMAHVGDVKEIVIDAGNYVKIGGGIRAKVRCVWSDSQDPDGRPNAGFQIIEIDEDALDALKDLIKRLTFIE
ncbi:MAG: response regulator [Desulfomonilaceae bacterium]|nr:response regulator [Desulfomonilaceae bacterium]